MQQRFRLRHSRDFARLQQEGRAYRHAWLILSTAPNALTHNRYGFITGKRLGKAVVRNRLRRQLREVIRDLHPHLKTGQDIVLIARHTLVGKPFAEIRRIVYKLCQQARLLQHEAN